MDSGDSSVSSFVVQFPVSLRLNRLFSENLSHPESRDAEQLRKEVADNVSDCLLAGTCRSASVTHH